MPNRDQVLEALKVVIDPELRRDIVELEMVRSIEFQEGGVVDVMVSLTTAGCPIRNHFETAVADAVGKLEGVERVNVAFDVLSDTEKGALQQKLGRAALPEGALAEVRNVICVASGKGGVGKSTLTSNLAAAFAADGKKAGALDADVWGYSIPRMLGLGAQRPKVSAERKILPLEAHGVKVMSIGFFLEEDSAVVWRGPMLHKALQQFLEDVAWGELDYLIVDLPPGTGDVSMTLAQLLPQAKFVLCTTPQPAAQRVARRAAELAIKFKLEIAGVVENMAGFDDPRRRALPDLRRGRRPVAGRRARGSAARPGAADRSPARALRCRHAPRAGRSGRSCRSGDPPGGARHHRRDASRAPGDAGALPGRGTGARRDVAPDGLGRAPGPAPRPRVERREGLEQPAPLVRQPEALARALGDPRLAQLAQALVEHAGGHPVAGRLQVAERQRLAPELPDDAQRPAAAEQVEQGHDRPARWPIRARGLRAGDPGSRRCLVLLKQKR